MGNAKSTGLPPETAKVHGIKKDSEKCEHPGTVADIHKKCRDVQATPFDGALVIFKKGINNFCGVLHTYENHRYGFGATYVGAGQNNAKSYSILQGLIDLQGNLDAIFIHKIGPNLHWKCTARFEEQELKRTNIFGEYRGNGYSVALSLDNPDFINGAGAGVAQYLQSVTRNLALGVQLVCHYGPHVAGSELPACLVVGKYTSGDTVWSGTVGTNLLHFSYYEKNSPQLQIGVEVQTCLSARESVAKIGYQLDIPKLGIVFRQSADTRMNVSGVLEMRLRRMALAFALSLPLNYNNDQFQMGCALILG